MDRKVARKTGQALYKRCQAIIEPVFGQIKQVRGIRRFTRRGRAAADSEWQLIAGTHNLLKLYRRALARVSTEPGAVHSPLQPPDHRKLRRLYFLARALPTGLFAALLFCTTPLGSWIPDTLGSASHKVADVGGSLATVGADAPAPAKVATVGGQR